METLKKQSLFWDTELEKLDSERHKIYIIKRILERGDLDDFRWLVGFYGQDEVENVFQENAGQLDSKSLNFWCVNFNIDKEKCIAKQSMKKQGAFWKR